MEGEVVFCEFGNPSRLSAIEFLRLAEILEILVVGPDFNVNRGAHEVVSPFFQGEHDGKEFLVIYLIVAE